MPSASRRSELGQGLSLDLDVDQVAVVLVLFDEENGELDVASVHLRVEVVDLDLERVVEKSGDGEILLEAGDLEGEILGLMELLAVRGLGVEEVELLRRQGAQRTRGPASRGAKGERRRDGRQGTRRAVSS